MHAALYLIEEHGIRGFTLKDAAQMAGVSPAAPYRHFPDKQALIAAIHLEGFELFYETMSASYNCTNQPAERLEELGVAYVMFALEHPAHFRVMFGRGLDESHAETVSDKGFLLLIQAVAELYPSVPSEKRHDIVLSAWSLVHGFALLQMEGAFQVAGGIPNVEIQLRRLLRPTTISSPIASPTAGS